MPKLPQPLDSRDPPQRLSPTEQPAWLISLIAVAAFLVSFVVMLFLVRGGIAIDLTALGALGVMLAFLFLFALAARYGVRNRAGQFFRFEGDWTYFMVGVVVISFWICVAAYFWSILPKIHGM